MRRSGWIPFLVWVAATFVVGLVLLNIAGVDFSRTPSPGGRTGTERAAYEFGVAAAPYIAAFAVGLLVTTLPGVIGLIAWHRRRRVLIAPAPRSRFDSPARLPR